MITEHKLLVANQLKKRSERNGDLVKAPHQVTNLLYRKMMAMIKMAMKSYLQ